MKTRIIFIGIVISLSITSCVIPGIYEPTSENIPATQAVSNLTSMPDQIATQAAMMLTALPSPTGELAQPETDSTPIVLVPTIPSTIEIPTLLPSVTSTPENNTVPIDTQAPAEPTATAISTDPKIGLGNPTWIDNFENDANWDITPETHTHYAWDGYNLILTALKADNFDGWTLRGMSYRNYYLEATFTPKACEGLDRYGLVVRAPDVDAGYLFGFSCNSKYSFRRWDGSHYAYLKDWTRSDKVLPGPNQSNRMGIMVQGNRFSLYANGYFLADITDAFYIDGRFGPFIASVNTTNFKTYVEEIAYWALP